MPWYYPMTLNTAWTTIYAWDAVNAWCPDEASFCFDIAVAGGIVFG